MDEYKIIRGCIEGKEKYCRIPIQKRRKTDEEISAAIENLEAIEIIDAQEDTGIVADAPKEIYEAFGTAISAMQELQWYRALEGKGLLVKLFCKRGDIVYFIKSAFSIATFPIEAKVVSINGVDCDNDVMYSAITNYNKTERRFESSDIGKTVFLTQAEAEEALKKMKGK